MKFWRKIEDNLYVIYSELLEDFRAVLSSKVSRRLDLDSASNLNKNDISNFLLKNLSNYGHASIAEMSFPTIFVKKLGWISSWIIEDDPLFLGQEVSTRAVSKGILEPCMEFDHNFMSNFLLFKNIFLNLKNNILKSKNSYKYDFIRWSLPGAFSSGIILNVNSRILNRILCRLKKLSWFNKCIYKKIEKGFFYCCPNVFQSLSKKQRNYSILWNNIDIYEVNDFMISKRSVSLDFSLFDKKKFFNSNIKFDFIAKEYLDKVSNYFGVIKIKIYCSLAAARDWHRHRSLMPWKLSLLVNKKRESFIYDLYDIKSFYKEVNSFYNKKKINKYKISYYDLYCFPMGTCCCIEGIGNLSNLLYTLKLRSESLNANFEYKQQALMGLSILFKNLNNK